MWMSILTLGDLIPVLLIVGGVVSLLLLIAVLARNYIKVPPNRAAVFYGKKSKITLIEQQPDPDHPGQMRPVPVNKISGHTVISGGAKFRWPIVEDVAFLDLDAFQLGIRLSNIPNIDGVPVSIDAVATCKIQSDNTSLMTAVERFLSKPDVEIHAIVKENLEGQLRAVVGTMNVEELIKNREKLNNTVKTEAAEELAKIGVGIEILNIQSINDPTGYIDALGKKRTAEVKRDAEIGTAEAERDARKAATNANREGSVVAADNEAKVAEAEKERDTAKARYQAEIEAERAKAAQAGPKAEAVARQRVVVEQVKVEEEEARSRIAVKEQKIQVAEKEQEATVVVPARKAADAKAAHAEGERQRTVIEAAGQREAEIKLAEADKQKRVLEGEGEAARIRTVGAGEAARIQAIGEAEASRTKAVGLAEAEAIKAKLLAEAEGALKKAEAYAALNEAGALQMILEKLPEIVGELSKVMGAVAEPMKAIDKVVIIDQGSDGPGSSGGINRFANNAPRLLFGLFEQMQAMGFDIRELFGKLGVRLDSTADKTARAIDAAEPVSDPKDDSGEGDEA